jgi:deazaflavin-dependent oxidoreductase (nitroreductase family)
MGSILRSRGTPQPVVRRSDMADVQRLVMRAMGALNVGLYRASGGRVMGKVRGVQVLLLTVAGRRTRVEHTTPVSYIEDGDRFIVTGSGGGSRSEPQWFRNLRHADRAVIEVGRRRINVAVAIAGPEQHRILWEQLLARAPFFGKYQEKVERQIPMAVLTPTR